jgi:hypothetical protein
MIGMQTADVSGRERDLSVAVVAPRIPDNDEREAEHELK